MFTHKFGASVNIPISSLLSEHLQKIKCWNRYEYRQSEYI